MIEWLQYGGTLAALAVVAFVQNMTFTAVSRSRNSGDPTYHRKCAWLSNGVWFMCHFFIWNLIWGAFETGEWWRLAPVALVYTVATAEGSVAMMKILLKKESGKRRVGARG